MLDAGCGTAELAALVSAPEAVCVDGAEAAVEAARARGFETHRARLEQPPLADGSFGVARCNWTLYHLPDPAAGIAELAHATRRNAVLVTDRQSPHPRPSIGWGAAPPPTASTLPPKS